MGELEKQMMKPMKSDKLIFGWLVFVMITIGAVAIYQVVEHYLLPLLNGA